MRLKPAKQYVHLSISFINWSRSYNKSPNFLEIYQTVINKIIQTKKDSSGMNCYPMQNSYFI